MNYACEVHVHILSMIFHQIIFYFVVLQIAIMRFETSGTICMESFKDHPQLGRFTLRDEGKQLKVVVFFIEFVFVSV